MAASLTRLPAGKPLEAVLEGGIVRFRVPFGTVIRMGPVPASVQQFSALRGNGSGAGPERGLTPECGLTPQRGHASMVLETARQRAPATSAREATGAVPGQLSGDRG